jgi:hypothetical protein
MMPMQQAKLSIGLMFWLLARDVLTMRGTVTESNPWTEVVSISDIINF